MKKIILGLFILLNVVSHSCELDDMTNYFVNDAKLVDVQEDVLYINNMKWWRNMSVSQKERLANIFRNKSINHKEKIYVSIVKDNYTGETLAEFKAWDNEIKIVSK